MFRGSMLRGPAPGSSIALPNIGSAAETTMQLSAFERAALT